MKPLLYKLFANLNTQNITLTMKIEDVCTIVDMALYKSMTALQSKLWNNYVKLISEHDDDWNRYICTDLDLTTAQIDELMHKVIKYTCTASDLHAILTIALSNRAPNMPLAMTGQKVHFAKEAMTLLEASVIKRIAELKAESAQRNATREAAKKDQEKAEVNRMVTTLNGLGYAVKLTKVKGAK